MKLTSSLLTAILLFFFAAVSAFSQPEVQAIYARGQEHFKAKRYDDAIREYTEVIRLRPDVSGVYHSRALCYYNKKVLEPALTYQQQAAVDAKLKPGETQPKSPNSISAIADFSKAIQLNPKSYASYYWRGQTYKWENDLEPAILDLEKFIQLYPNYESDPIFAGANIHLTNMGNDYASALVTRGLYELIFQGYASDRDDRTPEQARQDAEREQAIKTLFEKAVKFYKPVSSGTFAGRARAYFQLNNLSAAIADFAEAVKQNPNDATLINEMANAYKKNGQNALAIEAYNKVLVMPETYAGIKIAKNDALYRRGEIYFEENKLHLAIADLNNVIAAVPTYYLAYFLRGKVFAKQGKKILARADFVKASETSSLKKLAQIEIDALDGKTRPKAPELKVPSASSANKQKLTFERPTYAGESIYYEVQVLNGKANGYGEATTSFKHSYKGQWKDNDFHGQGKLTFANGEIYEGEWILGQRTANSVYYWPNGDRYSGEYGKNYSMHGKGTYTWANGDRYVGQWKDGKAHGHGKLTYASGKIEEGRFENGVFRGSLKGPGSGQ